MYQKFVLPLATISLLALLSFSFKKRDTLVKISTPYGDMKVKLYDETPLHQENFLKLVDEQFYDSTLFHRVINQFMIQGGDPESKNAKAGAMLGNGGPGYQIPAEFNPNFIHKKGALAAARQGDNVNPKKESSGSQFYIVHGTTFDSVQLGEMESKKKGMMMRSLGQAYLEAPENAQCKQDLIVANNTRNRVMMDSLNQVIMAAIQPQLDSTGFTAEQKEIYATIGGAPHLDGEYTVFGEVIEGLDIIDSIATQPTNNQNRPNQDIWMVMKKVRK